MTATPTQYEKIFCDEVDYRQGVIELSADIHPGLINLEVFGIEPGADLSIATSDNFDFEKIVKSTAEVELSLQQAKKLVEQLQHAVSTIEGGADV